jgi:EAL domain-containing protein (putative c-di-GMP-specific phosphodiesterase class I)
VSTLLDRILEPGALRVVFQPVVTDAWPGVAPHYLEAFVRGPQGTNLEQPEILFDYARRKHGEVEVDRACLRAVLQAARALPETTVGVNMHSATLAADFEALDFLAEQLALHDIPPERLIVEVVEQGQPWDQGALLLALAGLRDIGVRVALDDFGTGHSNYRMFLECRPEYIKVDRYFVDGCAKDPARQAFLASIVGLAGRIGSRVVAEGIEQAADLECLRATGIGLFQGFLLGRPAPARDFAPDQAE